MPTSAPAPANEILVSCDAKVVSIEGQLIVSLPANASAALPSRGQVAVTGTINGHAFETVVEPDGRRGHWVKLGGMLPAPKGLAAGEVVNLTLAPAKAWPEPKIPADFQAALNAASDVGDLWQSITPMARWEWVRWVCSTKSESTRARRVEVGISKLRDGKRRPCCFDLSACTDPDLAKSGKLIEPE